MLTEEDVDSVQLLPVRPALVMGARAIAGLAGEALSESGSLSSSLLREIANYVYGKKVSTHAVRRIIKYGKVRTLKKQEQRFYYDLQSRLAPRPQRTTKGKERSHDAYYSLLATGAEALEMVLRISKARPKKRTVVVEDARKRVAIFTAEAVGAYANRSLNVRESSSDASVWSTQLAKYDSIDRDLKMILNVFAVSSPSKLHSDPLGPSGKEIEAEVGVVLSDLIENVNSAIRQNTSKIRHVKTELDVLAAKRKQLAALERQYSLPLDLIFVLPLVPLGMLAGVSLVENPTAWEAFAGGTVGVVSAAICCTYRKFSVAENLQ